jgi:hypothetical protein
LNWGKVVLNRITNSIGVKALEEPSMPSNAVRKDRRKAWEGSDEDNSMWLRASLTGGRKRKHCTVEFM